MSANDSAQPMDLSEKGKGKQIEQGDSAEMSMDDESSGEESGAEEVSFSHAKCDSLRASSNVFIGSWR